MALSPRTLDAKALERPGAIHGRRISAARAATDPCLPLACEPSDRAGVNPAPSWRTADRAAVMDSTTCKAKNPRARLSARPPSWFGHAPGAVRINDRFEPAGRPKPLPNLSIALHRRWVGSGHMRARSRFDQIAIMVRSAMVGPRKRTSAFDFRGKISRWRAGNRRRTARAGIFWHQDRSNVYFLF